MRQCKKCGTKFEHDESTSPNPKCPKCGQRATCKIRQAGNNTKKEKPKGLRLWDLIHARKLGLTKTEEET